MKKLTFKEFEKNKTYILAVTEEQKEKRYEWLKENDYEYLQRLSMKDNFKCHGGRSSLNMFATGRRSFDNVYRVDQLEWKPKFKVDDVIKCIEDTSWGKVGDIRRVFGVTENNGYISYDTILKKGHHICESIEGKFIVVDKDTLTVKELKDLGFEVSVDAK